tara:strand:+ start:12060 stop:12710 length:651 start_codon:yes stop_codon:yes gene_type:complete
MSNVKKKELTTFEKLSAINVNTKIDKKGGLSYLSWAWSWSEVKKACPDANYTIYENYDGLFYHNDGKTAWVKTGVTIEGVEHIEYLPIMNFSNKSVNLENITSVDVNKAIQRSITKASARHGLGMYIYAGEDLPEVSTNEQVAVAKAKATAGSISKVKKTNELITLKRDDANWGNIMGYVSENKDQGLKKLTDMVARKYIVTTLVKTEISNLLKTK